MHRHMNFSRIKSPERPIPTVAQAHQLADAIDPRMRCLVLVAAFIGLRKGELLGLRRRDIDLDHRTIPVAQQRQVDRHGRDLVGPPKTDAGFRTLAIPTALVVSLVQREPSPPAHRNRRSVRGDAMVVVGTPLPIGRRTVNGALDTR